MALVARLPFGTIEMLIGSGAPSDSASNGSVYLRTDGAAGTTVYMRVGGAWVANAEGSGGGGLSDGDYGDITVGGGGTTMTIDPAVVTLAKMANLAADTAIGRVTASTGVPETFTVTAAGRAILDDANAAAQLVTLGAAAASHSHAAADTTSGTFDAARIPNLDAAKITSGTFDDARIPSTIARDSEVTTAISNHEGGADPHTVYQKESEKGNANGYASLGAGGLVPIAQLASGTPTGSLFVRDDNTLAAPTASVAAPFTGNQATGSFTIATGQFGVQGLRLTLAAAERATLAGTARLVICG